MLPGELKQLVKETLTNKILDQMANDLLEEFELKKDMSFNERCQYASNFINKLGA